MEYEIGMSVYPVDLVPDEHLDEVRLGGVGVELREPVLEPVEAAPVRHIVHCTGPGPIALHCIPWQVKALTADDALGPPVVARRQRPEPLLSRRVL